MIGRRYIKSPPQVYRKADSDVGLNPTSEAVTGQCWSADSRIHRFNSRIQLQSRAWWSGWNEKEQPALWCEGNQQHHVPENTTPISQSAFQDILKVRKQLWAFLRLSTFKNFSFTPLNWQSRCPASPTCPTDTHTSNSPLHKRDWQLKKNVTPKGRLRVPRHEFRLSRSLNPRT